MRKLLTYSFMGLLLSSSTPNVSETASQTPPDKKTVVDYANTITAEDLKKHLYTYASDEFEGRETGTRGQKKAVEYLSSNYKNFGIAHPSNLENYYQPVPLVMNKPPKATLTFGNETWSVGTDFIPVGSSSDVILENTSVVFAGYGIDSEQYSDYNGLDVKGKIVLVRAGEPKKQDGTYVITETKEPSEWSNFRPANNARVKAAQEKGALGILVLDMNIYGRLSSRYAYTAKLAESGRGSISLKGNVLSFFNWYLSETAAKKLYGEILTAGKSVDLKSSLNIHLTNDAEAIMSENVVAYIEGSEFPDEYVVVSSHLDHIGISPDGQINNGADDDGSGTVSVLEIAQAFAQAKKDGHGPRRSIVFLNVTGEEKGLLGSEYYSEHPVFPLENTVADLNIDMIGRTDPKRAGSDNYVYLIGADKLSTELHNLSEEVNKKYVNLDLDYTYNDEHDPNQFYYRSDHYNFAKHNVPIIFYFNGTHEDYHRPGDTPDKIRYDLLEKRARLVFYTAWELVNRDKRIVVDKAK